MICLHGLDARFCARCNKPSALGGLSRSIGVATLADIVAFLNHEQIRATDGAVGGAIGIAPRALGAHLGPRTIEASWIVSGETGLPAGYSENEVHPALLSKGEVIGSAVELLMKMSAWKAAPKR